MLRHKGLATLASIWFCASLWAAPALAQEGDLELMRMSAAHQHNDMEAAWAHGSAALHAAPESLRTHQAWQDMFGPWDWLLTAQYQALADSGDPELVLLSRWYLARSTGSPLEVPPEASAHLQRLAQAQLAVQQGEPGQALQLLEAASGPQAAALRLEARWDQRDKRGLRRELRDCRERWPDRLDLMAWAWRDDSLFTAPMRKRLVRQARETLASSDALSVYRAHQLLVAAKELELAQQASARLVALGEPLAPAARSPWAAPMVRDLGRMLALQSTPKLPPGGTQWEDQRVLVAAARELARKGRMDRSAELWRQALALRPAPAGMLLEGAMTLERAKAPPDELIELARQARVAAAGELVPVQGQDHYRALGRMAWSIEARSHVRAGRLDEGLMATLEAEALGAGPEVTALRGELLERMDRPAAAYIAYQQASAAGVRGLEERIARLEPMPGDQVTTIEPPERPNVPAAGSRAVTEPRLPERTWASSQGEFVLGATQGLDVVVFWASWCRPCAEELPALNELAGRLRGEGLEVRIIAVSVDERQKDAARWLKDRELPNLATAWDPELGAALQLKAIPSTFVTGSDRVVKVQHQGYMDGDVPRLEAELRELLQ